MNAITWKANWDWRYGESGRIFGRDPSHLAKWCVHKEIITPGKRVLDLGCGYGRDSIFFAKLGADATGVDSSKTALGLAFEDTVKARVSIAWVNADICNLAAIFAGNSFDVVFSNYLLHLHPEARDRIALVGEMKRILTASGCVVASLLSTADAGFGTGKEIAPNTFEIVPGKVHHFFTEVDAWKLFSPVTAEPMQELEVVGNSVRLTRFLAVVARKGGDLHD